MMFAPTCVQTSLSNKEDVRQGPHGYHSRKHTCYFTLATRNPQYKAVQCKVSQCRAMKHPVVHSTWCENRTCHSIHSETIHGLAYEVSLGERCSAAVFSYLPTLPA
eukprot:scaffold17178_cov14-Prasinocladus_malaysianus.AAC.1